MKKSQITEFTSKNIIDPSIQTIPLIAVKQLHAKEMQGYDDLIERLQSQINETLAELEAERNLKTETKELWKIYDQVSFHCQRDKYREPDKRITIVECADRIRNMQCPARTASQRVSMCRDRQNVLKRIHADEKPY